ncbi:MAG TPA: hypothetical protein VGV89_10080 [Thermoplasmata archaeon]|nr:hypothetical protein [Thermoplasmata archaeon]
MADVSSEGTGAPRDPRVEDRIVELLEQHPGALAFNGIRRTLRVHPESLTRALKRLERYGVVAREATGYRLSATPAPDETGPEPEGVELPRTSVAEVQMAPGLSEGQILGMLAGRWAGNLRWVGVYDSSTEPLLAWSRTDGPGQVLLGYRTGVLRVYTEPYPPTEALSEAARNLLVYALGRVHDLAPPSTERGVSAFRLGPRRVDFGPN